MKKALILSVLLSICLASFPRRFAVRSASGFTGGDLKQAAEARKALYEQFMPTPEDLGSDWLLPWQLPAPVRRFQSMDEFWMSGKSGQGGAFDDSGEMTPMILTLAGLPENQVRSRIDSMVSEMKSLMGTDGFPPGVSADRFILALILLQVRAELSPSLAGTMSLMCDYLQELLPILRKQVEAETTDEGEGGGEDMDASTGQMMQAILKPFQGMNAAQLKQEIIDEVLSVNKSTAMSYAKCDNWNALKSDKADPSQIHFGQVTVRMLVLDRERMAKAKTDLSEKKAARLKRRLSAAFKGMLALAVDAEEMEKDQEIKKVGEGLPELESAEKSDLDKRFDEEKKTAREGIQALREKRDKELAEWRKELQGTDDEVLRQSIENHIRKIAAEYDKKIAETEKEMAEIDERRRSDRHELDKKQRDRQKDIDGQKQEREEEFQKTKRDMPTMLAQVYMRDFGDNCYVIRMGGTVKKLDEFSSAFPYGFLNASLRNGNAVIHIVLSGNFTEKQFEAELDHFLEEMDARTAFFRE